ncbi:MAG: hypothetical protein PHX21_05390 [bacterium]|nr:hypothetical protein [bacterium]
MLNNKFQQEKREDCIKIILHRAIDGQFSGWLLLPVFSQLRREDFIRLAISKYFQIGQIVDTLFAINGLSIKKGYGYEFEKDLNMLSVKPQNTIERLKASIRNVELKDEIEQILVLIKDIIALIVNNYPELSKECEYLLEQSAQKLTNNSSQNIDNLRYIADKIIHGLHEDNKSWSIIIYGSFAMGQPDSDSDADMRVYCDSIPSKDMRMETIKSIIPEVKDFKQSDEEDMFWVEGHYLHINFVESRKIDEILSRFPKFYWSDDDELEAVQSGIICFDSNDRVLKWKHTLENVSPDTVINRINVYLSDTKWWNFSLKKGIDSKDLISIYFYLVEGMYALCNVIFALNGLFLVFPKWMKQTDSRMKIKPKDFYSRLVHIVNTEFSFSTHQEKVKEFFQLWNETLGLIEKRYPDIDLSEVRHLLQI